MKKGIKNKSIDLQYMVKTASIKICCFFLLLPAIGLIESHAQSQTKNYATLVNTLIGTEGRVVDINQKHFEAGFTFPGAAYPFGMVQLTPVTSFFDAKRGFVINQLSGAGCAHMSNLPTLPVKGLVTSSPADMKNMLATHVVKDAIAGYYRADWNGINTELTVTQRTGMAQFQFPEYNGVNSVMIGTGINATTIEDASARIIDNRSFEGYADGGSFCRASNKVGYKVYFYGMFSDDAIETGVWEKDKLGKGKNNAGGENSGVYFSFKNKRTVTYKIGVSYVSIKNAKENLLKENNGFNLDRVKKQAINEWNKHLGLIGVSGGARDQTVQFYTHLYHALLHPNIFNDVNGEYAGADGKIHVSKKPYYTSFSNWDTYRTQIQLLSMLFPERVSQMVQSLITFAEQSGGGFPRWVLANTETGVMLSDPTPIIVANAYAFGARNFDHKKALQIMRNGAENPGVKSQDKETRPLLEQYLKTGFIPPFLMLEYNSSDYAIGQFAKQALNKTDIYKKYLERSRKWETLYNPENRWIQIRDTNGSWGPIGNGWVEGTYKNFFWMVPHDLEKLIDTKGGKAFAEKRLDSFFVRLDANYAQDWFASGNEPDIHAPWIYNWTDAPYKTQQVVKRIIREQYQNAADGMPGNDDLGTLGAWYVFASIGMYPMIPGVGGFTINGPAFQNIKIKLPGGVLKITGGSLEKPYIKGIRVNKKQYSKYWMPFDAIKSGARIDYKLSGEK